MFLSSLSTLYKDESIYHFTIYLTRYMREHAFTYPPFVIVVGITSLNLFWNDSLIMYLFIIYDVNLSDFQSQKKSHCVLLIVQL